MKPNPINSIRQLTRAWKRKDAPAMAAWLTDDIVEIGPAFPAPIRGKRSFFRHYEDYLQGALRIVSYRMIRPQMIRLSTLQVLVHFTYTMRTRKGTQLQDSRGKESMVLRREKGRWMVQFIHWHRDPQGSEES